MSKDVAYLFYHLLHTLLWLLFILCLVIRFDNPRYLWLLVLMIVTHLYSENKKEKEDAEENQSSIY